MPQSNPTRTGPDIRDIWRRFRDDVKQSYPIDEALKNITSVQIRKRGTRFMCHCPFHVDKTPSMAVDTHRGGYRCFGNGCEASGDVFTLYQDVRGLDFPSAVIAAAEDCGVPVPDQIRMINRKKDSSPQIRKPRPMTPQYDRRPQIPADAHPAHLPAIPGGIPFPEAGQWFRLWDDRKENPEDKPSIRRLPVQMVHVYRNPDGEPIHLNLRCVGRSGVKFFMPARLGQPVNDCPGTMKLSHPDLPEGTAWMMLPIPTENLKPIYGLEELRPWLDRGGERNLLVVEGEKTRDAARRLLDAAGQGASWMVVSLMGNGQSAHMADWSPIVAALQDNPGDTLRVHIWPDADPKLIRRDGSSSCAQMRFIENVANSARQALSGSAIPDLRFFGIRGLDDMPAKWDLADAEADHWSGDDVLDHIAENLKVMDAMPQENPQGSQTGTQQRKVEEGLETSPFERGPLEEIDPTVASIDALLEETSDTLPLAEIDAQINTQINADEPAATLGADDDEGDLAGQITSFANNEFFRCLGFLGPTIYFFSKRNGSIISMTASTMRSVQLLHLAPKHWWESNFPKKIDQNGAQFGVNWEDAIDVLISVSYESGIWDPNLEAGTGARFDGGLVTYNLGDRLFVEGRGVIPLSDFDGQFLYTASHVCPTPDFDNPFTPESEDLRAFIEIVRKLNWRDDRRSLSVMALIGWMAISPICGMLRWRPHLWLDGPIGSGKSWIIEKMISRVFGKFAFVVKGNSTESGLRNLLDRKALPVIFDEAEGETQHDRMRMDEILRMARHASNESNAYIVKGVSGGGGEKTNRVEASFLLCSITPQLAAAADKSRFVRVHLNHSKNTHDFENTIEIPCEKLLTSEFSRRFIARMILRAPDYHDTFRVMVKYFMDMRLTRRLADVYASLATGVWLLLREGIPYDDVEAGFFLEEEFSIFMNVNASMDDIRNDNDHNRIFDCLQQYPHRFDSAQFGTRTVRIATLIETALGLADEENETGLSVEEALRALKDIGIRPGQGGKLWKPGDGSCDTILIHRNSETIRNILQNTPYARSYGDVMLQANGASISSLVVRFFGKQGVRPVVVPLSFFTAG